ncbi:cytochrome c-type biogenesis protein CcmH [Candidatus Pelagibacter sp.]|nr:cytochrome c-type biogenesis protein CcmH [Candidatus Pelagibacter sp.]
MKLKRLLKIKILIIFIFTYFSFNNTATSSSFSEEQTINITKNLRCLICQGQTIHESNSDFAESMKKYIKGELENGKTNDEVFSSLIEKYGQWIVYDPGISRNTLLLWSLPLLLFLIGGVIIAKKIFRKKKYE